MPPIARIANGGFGSNTRNRLNVIVIGTMEPATPQPILAENAYVKNEPAELRHLIFSQKHERFVSVSAWRKAGAGECSHPRDHSIINAHLVKKDGLEAPSNHNPLPAHLHREEMVIAPRENVHTFKKIGEEIAEELEYKLGGFANWIHKSLLFNTKLVIRIKCHF